MRTFVMNARILRNGILCKSFAVKSIMLLSLSLCLLAGCKAIGEEYVAASSDIKLKYDDKKAEIVAVYVSTYNFPGYSADAFVFYDNGICANISIPEEMKRMGVINLSGIGVYAKSTKYRVGVYRTAEDTIHVNMYDKFNGRIASMMMNEWLFLRYTFKKIDHDTLYMLYAINDGRTMGGVYEDDDLYHLMPVSDYLYPIRTHFLLKERWMWESANDWNEYMHSYRKKRMKK